MSVLAVRATDAGYEIAADSIVVSGWSQRKDSKFAKLSEVNGLILGGVGTSQETSLLYLYLKSHRPSPSEDCILECFSEFSNWKKEKTENGSIDNEYLLGFDRELFRINGYFVHHVQNYVAIGAGEDFATAALHLGHSPADAVRAAIELSTLCEGPIVSFERSGLP